MEADSTVAAAIIEWKAAENGVSEEEGAASAAVADEDASMGDNSLTSCEDDVSTTGDADEIAKLEYYHRKASSTAGPPHPSLCAPNASRLVLTSGLPTSLHLCKVYTHTT